jgi:hypothetical protein
MPPHYPQTGNVIPLHRVVDPRLDLYRSLAASNASSPRKDAPQHAGRGVSDKSGHSFAISASRVLLMLAVAVFLGFALAVQL